MTNRIVSNERSIVKDIINYKFPKNKDLQGRHIAKIVAFALHNMSDEYAVDNSQVSIMFDKKNKERSNARFNFVDTIASISKNVLKDRKGYGEDIIAICHEMGHFCDYNGVIGENGVRVGNKSAIDSIKFNKFVARFLLGMGEYRKFTQPQGMYALIKLAEDTKDYCFARYILDPAEIKARRFACDMLEKIIDIANFDIGISNVNEYFNVKALEAKLNERKDLDFNNIKRADNAMEANHERFTNMIRIARAGLLREDESYKNAFDRLLDIDPNNYPNYVNVYGDIIEDMYMGLILDYDDDTANVIFNTISCMDDKLYRKYTDVLCGLCISTNFEPSDEQAYTMYERGAYIDDDVDRILDISRSTYILE